MHPARCAPHSCAPRPPSRLLAPSLLTKPALITSIACQSCCLGRHPAGLALGQPAQATRNAVAPLPSAARPLSPARRSPTSSAPIPIHRGNWTSHDIDLATRDLDLGHSPTLSLSLTSGLTDCSPPSEAHTPTLYVRPDPTYRVTTPPGVARHQDGKLDGRAAAAAAPPLEELRVAPASMAPSPPGKAVVYGFVPPTEHRFRVDHQHLSTLERQQSEQQSPSTRGRGRCASSEGRGASERRRRSLGGVQFADLACGSALSRSLPSSCGHKRTAPPPAPRHGPASPQVMPPAIALPPPSPAGGGSELGLSSSSPPSSSGVSMITTPSRATPTYVQVGFHVGSPEHSLLARDPFEIVAEAQHRRRALERAAESHKGHAVHAPHRRVSREQRLSRDRARSR